MSHLITNSVNEEECGSNEEQPAEGEKLYKRRWGMLLMFSIPSIVNGSMFMSMSAISDVVTDRFDVSTELVNMLGQLFYLVFLMCLPFGLVILGRRDGLREGTLIAAALNAVGAAIRLPITVGPPHLGFALLTVSNLVAAVSQPCFLVVPTLISSKWFGESERVTATAIAGLANQFGMALGYFTVRFAVDKSNFDSAMFKINLITFSVVAIDAACVYLLFEDHPPVGPTKKLKSSSIASTTRGGFLPTTKMIVSKLRANCSHYFLLLTVVFGCVVAIYWSLGLLLDNCMVDRFTSTEIAISGTLLLSAGIPGMYIGGLILDRHRHFKKLIIISFLIAILLLGTLSVLLASPSDLHHYVSEDWKPASIIVYTVCGLLGAFLGSLQPIFLELGVECTYPLSEEISSSILFLSATQFGLVLVFISEALTSYASSFINNLFFTCCLIILFVIFSVATPQLRRTNMCEAMNSAMSDI